jgi:hypothetical protein
MLALLPLLLLAFQGFAGDAAPASANGEEEGLSRAEIIGYASAAAGFVLMIVFAWFLTSRRSPAGKMTANMHTPGMRISSAHSNDPYMTRKKVVKKTS